MTQLRAGAVLILLALLLGLTVGFGFVADWDRGVMREIAFRQGVTPAWQIELARGVTWLGNPEARPLILLAAIAWLAWTRHGSRLVALLVTVGTGIAGGSIAKEVYGRERPTIVPHLDDVTTLSYPSGHAGNAMLLLLAVALMTGKGRRWTVPAAIALALAIGITRTLLGVHWPSDVIGGWLFGGGWALAGAGLYQRGAIRIAPSRRTSSPLK